MKSYNQEEAISRIFKACYGVPNDKKYDIFATNFKNIEDESTLFGVVASMRAMDEIYEKKSYQTFRTFKNRYLKDKKHIEEEQRIAEEKRRKENELRALRSDD